MSRERKVAGAVLLIAALLGGLVFAQSAKTGLDPGGGPLRKVVPVRVELLAGEAKAPTDDPWWLFDGDTDRSLAAPGRAPVRIRAALDRARALAAIGVFGPAGGRLIVSTVRNGEVTPFREIELSELAAGWHRFAAGEPVAARAVLFEWQPGAPGAALPEIELWCAEGTDPGGGATNGADRRFVDASPRMRQIGAGSPGEKDAGTFRFRLEADPGAFSRAFLAYELSGLPHWSAAVRSINSLPAQGGFAAAESPAPAFQIEEIHPRWLRRGINEVRFFPVAGGEPLPDGIASLAPTATAEADPVFPYTVAHLKLVLVGDGGRPLATGPGDALAAKTADSASAAALLDGDPKTGWNGRDAAAVDLPFARPSRPWEIEIATAGRPAGELRIEAALADGGTLTLAEPVDLAALAPGRHRLRLDDEDLPAAAGLRLSWSPAEESAGEITGVDVAASPVGAGQSAPWLVVSHPLRGEQTAEGAYLRGFAEPFGGGELFVDSVPVPGGLEPQDGAFGVFVPRPGESDAWEVTLEIVWPDGTRTARKVRLGGAPEDGDSDGDRSDDEAEAKAGPGEGKSLSVGRARLDVPGDALDKSVRLTMRALAPEELPALDAGMTNVTAKRGGFRLGPHGTKFKKPVRLTLPYDPALIPEGMSDDDVQTFWFDEATGRWLALPRLDGKSGGDVVVSATDHFTDFINATLALPDEPAGTNFSPNSVAELAEADPAAEIDLLEPPVGGPTGSAQLAFPLRLPPGRNGMAPDLAVVYDSDGSERGNGWLGVGWDLPVPTVEVSTRFGVPRYAGEERYLLEGEQLVPATTPGVYTRRVEGSFQRIERKGSGPASYWWEVTDRDGTRFIYGQSAGARLAGGQAGNVFRWYLERAVDLHGNTVEYFYRTDRGTPEGGGEPWVQVYPARIDYTGGPSAPHYSVEFVLDEGGRPDKLSSGLPGFKAYTRYRLDRVDVKAGGALVRRFQLEYGVGDFGKSLLATIAVQGENGTEFYRHRFGYRQVTRSDGHFDGFAADETWGCLDGSCSLAGDFATQSSFGGGGHAFVGVGDTACQAHGGVQVGAGGGETTLEAGFLDVDGDGRPDRLDPDGDRVDFNRYDPETGRDGFASGDFPGADDLGHITEINFDFGGGLHAVAEQAVVGGSWVWSNSLEDRGVADVNGDGRPDLVRGGSVLINTGRAFSPSAAWSVAPLDGADLSAAGQEEDVLEAFKTSDVLRKLVLPYSGEVTLSGTVRKLAAGGDDGVRVAVYHNRSRIWSQGIAPGDTAAYAPGLTVKVAAGDRLYFLASSVEETGADALEWSPKVAYSVAAEDRSRVEPYGARVFEFDAAADFRLAGYRGAGWSAPAKGTVRVLGALTKDATSDDVVARIVRSHPKDDGTAIDVQVYRRELGAAEVGSFDEVPEIAVEEGDLLYFRIDSDTPVDPGRILWQPVVTYEGGVMCLDDADGNESCGGVSCGAESCAASAAPDVELEPEQVTQAARVAVIVPLLQSLGRPTASWTARSAGTYTFRVSWSRSLPTATGPVLLYVQGLNRLLDKRVVAAGRTALDYFVTATVGAGEPVFFTSVADAGTGAGVLSARVEDVGGVPTNVRIRGEDDGLLSGGYHGWFYGEWLGGPDFDEREIKEPEEDERESPPFAAAVPRWWESDGRTGAPVWEASGHDFFIAAGEAKPSRQGSNAASDLRQADGGSADGAAADKAGGGPGLIRKTSTHTLGMSASFVAGVSLSYGNADTQLDFLDMNGDLYPDQVVAGKVRFADGRGGYGALTAIENFDGSVRHIEDGNFRKSVGGVGLGVTYNKKSGKGGSKSVSATLPSVGTVISLSQTWWDLADVNGDGLPDRVSMRPEAGEMAVRLNLGYRFGELERWPLPRWHDAGARRCQEAIDFGDSAAIDTAGQLDPTDQTVVDTLDALSLTRSAAADVGVAFGPIGGGVGTTLSRTVVDLVDVNGDGLLDHVAKDDGNDFFRVKLNRGDGWQPERRWYAPDWSRPPGDAYSAEGVLQCRDGLTLAGNVDGNGSVGAPVCIPLLVVGIQIEVSAQLSGADGGTQLSFEDFDGDGRPDHVLKKKGDSSVYVRRNQTGMANLLETVERPVGGTIALEYRRQGNRVDLSDPDHLVDMPHSQWALASTTLDDGRGNTYETTFDYGNDGLYDRAERESYGYAQVLTTLPDGSTTHRFFHNQSFASKGLLFREEVRDAAGNLFRVATTQYELRQVAGSPRAAFPARVGETVEIYEGAAGGPKTTRQSFAYDERGLQIGIHDEADAGAADDLQVSVAWHEDAATHVAKPSRVVVRDGTGRLLRERRAAYDGFGDLVRIEQTLAGGKDPATGAAYTGSDAAVTTYTYDVFGNLVSATDPAGFTSTVAYDPVVHAFPVQASDSFGYVSRFEYDLQHGVLTATVDENGATIRRVHDVFGRLTQVFGPDDGASPTLAFEYGHDARPAFAVVHHKDATRSDPIDKSVFIDGLGRVIQTKEDAELDLGSGTATRVGMRVSGRLEFDLRGRVAAEGQPVFEDGPADRFVEAPLQNPVRLEHDVLDRVRSVRFPHGAETRLAYGFGMLDGVARLTRTRTDAHGRTTRFFLDVEGNVLGVEQTNTIGGARKTLLTRYGYDALSQVTSIADAKGNVTRLEYDTLGRNVALDNPDAGRTEYRYDRAGNLGAKITANLAARGQQIRYLRTFHRLDRIDYPESPDVAFAYGAPGAPFGRADRVATVADASGTEEIFYGRLGEVVRTVKTATALNGSSPKGPYATEYRYDGLGRLLAVTYPDGEALAYGYDAGGRVKSARGVLAGARFDYLAHLGYDEFGARARLVYGNGVETRYAYDPQSRYLAQLQTLERGGRELQDLRYTHDQVGTVLGLVNDVALPSPPLYGGPAAQAFRYDDLYQLVAAEGSYRSPPNKTSTYALALAYDELGNVTAKRQLHQIATGSKPNTQKKTSYDQAYAYAGPRPHAPTRIGERTFGYDANGNQTGWESTVNGTRRTLAWDEENRLRAVADNGQTTRFLYDAAGIRANKAGPHGETIYVNPYFSIRNGAIASKHVYADDLRLATKVSPDSNPPSEKLYFYHGDHLGSTHFVTDSSGAAYQHLEYFPSGEIWVDERAETQRTPYLFSAKELDEETGLSYFGARYYDARQGQWISADPILDGMLDVEALAAPGVSERPFRLAGLPYGYAGNDPIGFVDPSGLMPKRAREGGGLSIGGRLAAKRRVERTKSERQKKAQIQRDDSDGRAVKRSKYTEPKESGIWSGGRPGWYEETWTELWKAQGSQTGAKGKRAYTCVDCGKTIQRRKDLGRKKAGPDDATIDHNTQYETYLREKAAPDESGLISTKAAKDAYNDLGNLKMMCRSCNSKKNGKKNVFD